MKTKILTACAAGFALLIFACKQNGSADKKQKDAITVETPASTQQESANQSIYSSQAAAANKDSSRKFIRTADIKFKVASVEKATYYIEDITTQAGGFVGNRG